MIIFPQTVIFHLQLENISPKSDPSHQNMITNACYALFVVKSTSSVPEGGVGKGLILAMTGFWKHLLLKPSPNILEKDLLHFWHLALKVTIND